MHSHVSNTPASTENYQSLHNLDQSQQTIITDEGVFKIRKVQANEQGEYVTPEGEAGAKNSFNQYCHFRGGFGFFLNSYSGV
jgi:hypothetical protein